MDFPDIPSGRSPRRELQGPRPTPLKIHKDSHKIKKPPAVPPQQPHAPTRQPVIIYTVSPKIIHTTPGDFMTLVQRLTGASASSSSTCSSSTDHTTTMTANSAVETTDNSGAISPAARYATIEKARSPKGKNFIQKGGGDMGVLEGIETGHGMDRPAGMFQGILSPGPAALSPIPANFFSPPTSLIPNSFSFFQDLSPSLQDNKNFMEGTNFMPSPSNFVSPHISPMDLFNYFSDS